jgi:hypothetical protein
MNDPENERIHQIPKNRISKKTRFEKARILPPILSIMRKDFLESKK